MKNKLNIRRKFLSAAAITAAFFIGISPIGVYAQSNENEEVCECEVGNDDPQDEEHFGPLTPEGNMQLVDDYGTLEAGGKQFITVVTKSGNYFYIIIDRDDNGNENVHFLNMVDEADLLKLMDDEDVDKYLGTSKKVEEEPVTPTPTPEPELVVEEHESHAGLIAFLLLSVVAGMGAYIYIKKKNEVSKPIDEHDPDEDYDEDEDDYLGKLNKETDDDIEYLDEED